MYASKNEISKCQPRGKLQQTRRLVGGTERRNCSPDVQAITHAWWKYTRRRTVRVTDKAGERVVSRSRGARGACLCELAYQLVISLG